LRELFRRCAVKRNHRLHQGDSPVKTSVAWLPAFLFTLAVVAGCGDSTPPKKEEPKKVAQAGGHQHVHLCTKCGFVEDSDKCGDNCCKVGVKCEKCDFIKGSPACCNEEIAKLVKAGEDHIVICEKCGNLEQENDACCKKTGAKKCAKCKHHEGSLLCIQECGPKKDTATKEGDSEKKEPEKKEAGKKDAQEKDADAKNTDAKDVEKIAPPKREPGKS
jgi:hypothetical protein